MKLKLNSTSDGKMVILGGYDCSISEKENKQLYHFDKATIFDTYTKRWYDQPIDGSYKPLPRAYHTAVTSKNRIYVYKILI
jgi:hypothetical protein